MSSQTNSELSRTEQSSVETWRSLTGFQRDLLETVARTPGGSGQDVRDTLGDEHPDHINHGRLYPNLDTLMDKSLLEKGSIDRRTNSYTLTAEGKQVLAVASRRLASARDRVE